MDRINKVVIERKQIKAREAARDQMSHLYGSNNSQIGRSHSQASLPAIKHQRRGAGNSVALKSEFNISTANSPAMNHSQSVSQIARHAYQECAMNRVKENQKKQMKVIQANLQRTEKNNIRLAVRQIKD